MSNIIDPRTNMISQPEPKDTQAINKRKYRSENETSSSDGQVTKDSASLSVEARLLAKAHTVLNDTPEVRAALVNDLRGRILSGSYEVPYERLAELIANRLK